MNITLNVSYRKGGDLGDFVPIKKYPGSSLKGTKLNGVKVRFVDAQQGTCPQTLDNTSQSLDVHQTVQSVVLGA